MTARDFYVGSSPTKFGASLGERAERKIVSKLYQKYNIRRLLEIGTGKGRIARACRELGIEYLGVDCSTEVVENANKSGFNVMNASVPPLPDLKGFKPDAIVTLDTLSNLPSYEQAQRFVTEIWSHLEQGGLFYAKTPELCYAKWFFWGPDPTRGFPTTKHRLARLLYHGGFNIIECAYQLDGFGWPWCDLIYYATKLVPYRLLDELTGKWSKRNLALFPSMWEMIHYKAPGVYIVGRKR